MPNIISDHVYLSAFIGVAYVLGLLCAAQAILRARTPQGATAWILSLLTFPYVAVPLFLYFGRSKFEGYNTRRRILDSKVKSQFDDLKAFEEGDFSDSNEMNLINATISNKNQPGFTRRNSIQLLINAEETYGLMLKEIEAATKYIVFQFYIVRDDEIGNRFIDLLVAKAQAGVRVTFLHDEIGAKLPRRNLQRLKDAGIHAGAFNSRHGRGRMQINFRNHRKILIVDGRVAFIGGHNIGDDYLGKWKRWGAWRDTHVRLEGPSVMAAQLASAKDWYCTQECALEVDWNVTKAQDDANVLVLHTGPADEKHTALLSHVALINSASKRLWIANPYFVPPESLFDAILLASLRGVDVRIILPKYSDSKTVMLATKVYQERLLLHGVKVYRYDQGFLHQKTMLVDDCFGVVGSVNMDCRSMFINFEIMAVSNDATFVRDMELMFEKDFVRSKAVAREELRKISLLEKLSSRGANLFAPVL